MSSPQARRGIARKLLAAGLGLVFALLFAEAALRLLGFAPPGFQPYPSTHARGLFAPRDDDRGYGYAPGFRCEVERAGRTTTVAINDRGFRDVPFTPLPEAGTRRILTVGCSLTAGWGLEAEASWPAQLERLLAAEGAPARVFNAGVTGYNMRQARSTAEQLMPELAPDVVVMGLYPTGLDRMELPFGVYQGYLVREFQMPRLRLEEDGFFQSLFRSEGRQALDQWLHRYFWVGAFALRALGNAKRAVQEPSTGPDLSPEAVAKGLAPLLDQVTALRDACRARGVRFAALVISIQEDDGSFAEYQCILHDLVTAHCEEREIPFAATLDEFRAGAGGEPVFKLPGDLHWSARAHARAAELLVPVVRGL